MGVQVSSEQHHLKKNQAGRPHGCRAAERRQQLFRGHGFDQKQEKGRQKSYDGKEN